VQGPDESWPTPHIPLFAISLTPISLLIFKPGERRRPRYLKEPLTIYLVVAKLRKAYSWHPTSGPSNEPEYYNVLLRVEAIQQSVTKISGTCYIENDCTKFVLCCLLEDMRDIGKFSPQQRSDRLWGPTDLICNVYRGLHSRAAGAWSCSLTCNQCQG
jgi:hypothetical protein